jgi:hypothetical protein
MGLAHITGDTRGRVIEGFSPFDAYQEYLANPPQQ